MQYTSPVRRIAELNDLARTAMGVASRLVQTAGISALAPAGGEVTMKIITKREAIHGGPMTRAKRYHYVAFFAEQIAAGDTAAAACAVRIR